MTLACVCVRVRAGVRVFMYICMYVWVCGLCVYVYVYNVHDLAAFSCHCVHYLKCHMKTYQCIHETIISM